MSTRAMIRRFFAYYRPHRRLFLLDFTCAILSGVLELAFPIAVGIMIDRLLPGENWGLIVLASIGLLGIYLLNTGLMVDESFVTWPPPRPRCVRRTRRVRGSEPLQWQIGPEIRRVCDHASGVAIASKSAGS